MDKKSRLRGPNFSSSDSSLLCDIILKHKHIIENKKTDGANLLQKQKAWLDVTEEFNCVTTGHHRTVESLQQNYRNLKKKAKKCTSDAKMDIPGTCIYGYCKTVLLQYVINYFIFTLESSFFAVDRETLVKNIEEYGTSSEGWEKIAQYTGASKENCQQLLNIMNAEIKTKEKALKKTIMGTGKSQSMPIIFNILLLF